MNKVMLLGYVGQDPTVVNAKDGKPITKFSVATNKKWKDKVGQDHEETEWHRIVTFGKLADITSKYVKKGSRVLVEGSIKSNQYKGKDGTDKVSYDIIANVVQFLDSKKGDAAPAQDNPDSDVPF